MHEFFTLSTGIHIFSRCECFGLTKQKQKIKLKTIEDIKKKFENRTFRDLIVLNITALFRQLCTQVIKFEVGKK